MGAILYLLVGLGGILLFIWVVTMLIDIANEIWGSIEKKREGQERKERVMEENKRKLKDTNPKLYDKLYPKSVPINDPWLEKHNKELDEHWEKQKARWREKWQTIKTPLLITVIFFIVSFFIVCLMLIGVFWDY